MKNGECIKRRIEDESKRGNTLHLAITKRIVSEGFSPDQVEIKYSPKGSQELIRNEDSKATYL